MILLVSSYCQRICGCENHVSLRLWVFSMFTQVGYYRGLFVGRTRTDQRCQLKNVKKNMMRKKLPSAKALTYLTSIFFRFEKSHRFQGFSLKYRCFWLNTIQFEAKKRFNYYSEEFKDDVSQHFLTSDKYLQQRRVENLSNI